MNPINISTSPAVFRWRPAAWLRVTGEDAATFLQGQFTNDLRPLEGGGVYGLWLTVKGKVLADSFVIRANGGGFWVGSYFSPAAIIRERLESYVIADDVVIEDLTSDWEGLSLIGELPADRLRPPEGVVVFPGRRARGGNVEWVMPVAQSAAVRAQLAGVGEWDVAAAEAQRIAAGIPAVPVDLGPGDLPNEAGLEAEAISYSKGCYLGQEVMARLKSMGQVRRKLVRVRIEQANRPAVPTNVFAGDQVAGELRSVASAPDGVGVIGLAMVSRLKVSPETKLGLAAGAAPNIVLLDAP